MKSIRTLVRQDQEKYVIPRRVQDVIPMYQMNEYELFKVHGEGQYPFTYRGENGIL